MSQVRVEVTPGIDTPVTLVIPHAGQYSGPAVALTRDQLEELYEALGNALRDTEPERDACQLDELLTRFEYGGPISFATGGAGGSGYAESFSHARGGPGPEFGPSGSMGRHYIQPARASRPTIDGPATRGRFDWWMFLGWLVILACCGTALWLAGHLIREWIHAR